MPRPTGDQGCPTLETCANCICSTSPEGCELTPGVFAACINGPVKIPKKQRNFETCSENPICTNRCIQNFLLATANTGTCTAGKAPAKTSCNEFAKVFKAKGVAKKCQSKKVNVFGRNVGSCCRECSAACAVIFLIYTV